MHALHKILANCARPRQASVMPGEFVEVEPDIFGVILGVNGSDAKRLVADLEELGIDELPLKDRIVAVADHASPAPTVAMAQAQKLWRDFFRAKVIRSFDGGAGVSHVVLCEEGIALPRMLGISIGLYASMREALDDIGMYVPARDGRRITLYAIGRYVIELPKVTLVRVSGTLTPGVFGRDASLYVDGQCGQRGAYNNAVEFAGTFIDQLSMDY